MPRSLAEVDSFMNEQRMAAFCTMDAGNRPHVVPVFFTYRNNKVYIHTDRKSQKICNLLKNPQITITVYLGEFGEEAVIIRGQAKIVDADEFVTCTQDHIDKYHIQLDEQGRDALGIPCFDNTFRCIIEITPERVLFW